VKLSVSFERAQQPVLIVSLHKTNFKRSHISLKTTFCALSLSVKLADGVMSSKSPRIFHVLCISVSFSTSIHHKCLCAGICAVFRCPVEEKPMVEPEGHRFIMSLFLQQG